jgi:beta-glucosidase
VVVVSTSNEVESEGFDRDTLRLPGTQDELVHAVAAVNDKTIVVVNAGAPVLLPWRDEVAAVLAVWFPGQEFGDALADVLGGDVEPGGRLPMTWPVDEAQLPVREVKPVAGRLDYREGIHIGYRAWRRSGLTPAYPFGHGLGYTQWELSELEVADLGDGESVTASLLATNVGARPGKTVVQLYLERVSESSLDRPERWLAGFESVRSGPGVSQRVEIEVPWRRFAHWAEGDWQLEAGVFRLIAGLSSNDDRLEATIAAGSRTARAAPTTIAAP